ncbi:MAG: DUF1127 domain-containing protein [Alphaproteobacteria bacterium]|nr:DUF1127 domain-containing protein [Alphaproteobacteria bacterium]
MALFTFTKTETTKKSTGFIAKYAETSRLRRAEKQLNRMNDRMLEDIGLSRGDVHGKVWGSF